MLIWISKKQRGEGIREASDPSEKGVEKGHWLKKNQGRSQTKKR